MFKFTLSSATLAVALLGLGSSAFAADDAMMSHDAMAKSTMATFVCRPAATGEKPTATITATNAGLVCKAVDAAAIMAMKKDIEAAPNGGLDWKHLMDDMNIIAHYG